MIQTTVTKWAEAYTMHIERDLERVYSAIEELTDLRNKTVEAYKQGKAAQGLHLTETMLEHTTGRLVRSLASLQTSINAHHELTAFADLIHNERKTK